MQSLDLQRWQTQLTALLKQDDIKGAVQHALSFPTPAYRLRSLLRVCREVRDPEYAYALLTQAKEQVALILQPQAQSHAWGRLCRLYAHHGYFSDAEECASRVVDHYARRAHQERLRRRVQADQKPQRSKQTRALLELQDIDSALLRAIVSARGENETEKAAWALLSAVGPPYRHGCGDVDRTLFRAAMHHALRWLTPRSRYFTWLNGLCLRWNEPALSRLFYEAALQAARREPDPKRRADTLIEQLRAARHWESLQELENLVEEIRAAIYAIPDRLCREQTFTRLAQHLHWLGWRGKRDGWHE